MKIKKNILPDLNNKECALLLLSKWTGEESNLRSSTVVSMNEVESSKWPDGLISYSCFLSDNKQRVLHCVQWKSPEHHLKYVENHLPKRLEKLEGKIVVESEKSYGRFKLKESRSDGKIFSPKFVLIDLTNQVTFEDKSEHFSAYQLQNIDTATLINYVELAEFDKEFLLNAEVNIYSLFGSYVCE